MDSFTLLTKKSDQNVSTAIEFLYSISNSSTQSLSSSLSSLPIGFIVSEKTLVLYVFGDTCIDGKNIWKKDGTPEVMSEFITPINNVPFVHAPPFILPNLPPKDFVNCIPNILNPKFIRGVIITSCFLSMKEESLEMNNIIIINREATQQRQLLFSFSNREPLFLALLNNVINIF